MMRRENRSGDGDNLCVVAWYDYSSSLSIASAGKYFLGELQISVAQVRASRNAPSY